MRSSYKNREKERLEKNADIQHLCNWHGPWPHSEDSSLPEILTSTLVLCLHLPIFSLIFSPLFSLSFSLLPYFHDLDIIKIKFWLRPYLTYISEKPALAVSLRCLFPCKLKPSKPSNLQWLWAVSSGIITMRLPAHTWYFCLILCEISTRWKENLFDTHGQSYLKNLKEEGYDWWLNVSDSRIISFANRELGR